jgi:hypothetical protein
MIPAVRRLTQRGRSGYPKVTHEARHSRLIKVSIGAVSGRIDTLINDIWVNQMAAADGVDPLLIRHRKCVARDCRPASLLLTLVQHGVYARSHGGPELS